VKAVDRSLKPTRGFMTRAVALSVPGSIPLGGAGDEEAGMSENDDQAKWSAAQWHGKMLVDRDGDKIGKLQDVYVDLETDKPQFGTVKTVRGRPTGCWLPTLRDHLAATGQPRVAGSGQILVAADTATFALWSPRALGRLR
jgi:hypothetical protein